MSYAHAIYAQQIKAEQERCREAFEAGDTTNPFAEGSDGFYVWQIHVEKLTHERDCAKDACCSPHAVHPGNKYTIFRGASWCDDCQSVNKPEGVPAW
jgi:hypothetical protein